MENTSQGDGCLGRRKISTNIGSILPIWQRQPALPQLSWYYFQKIDVSGIAYQDLQRYRCRNQTIAGPNGVISRDHGEDYAKLASNRRHGVNTKLAFSEIFGLL